VVAQLQACAGRGVIGPRRGFAPRGRKTKAEDRSQESDCDGRKQRRRSAEHAQFPLKPAHAAPVGIFRSTTASLRNSKLAKHAELGHACSAPAGLISGGSERRRMALEVALLRTWLPARHEAPGPDCWQRSGAGGLRGHGRRGCNASLMRVPNSACARRFPRMQQQLWQPRR